jgi:predicted DNA-binding mobile mystery protein A
VTIYTLSFKTQQNRIDLILSCDYIYLVIMQQSMGSSMENPGIEKLDQRLAGLDPLLGVQRPSQGWIRAIREAIGVSAGEVGRILGVSRQLPLQFERAEVEDSITLKSLRAVANALDCDLVYALAPRAGSLQALAESRSRFGHASAATPQKPEYSPGPVPREERISTLHDTHFCD